MVTVVMVTVVMVTVVMVTVVMVTPQAARPKMHARMSTWKPVRNIMDLSFLADNCQRALWTIAEDPLCDNQGIEALHILATCYYPQATCFYTEPMLGNLARSRT